MPPPDRLASQYIQHVQAWFISSSRYLLLWSREGYHHQSWLRWCLPLRRCLCSLRCCSLCCCSHCCCSQCCCSRSCCSRRCCLCSLCCCSLCCCLCSLCSLCWQPIPCP